MKKSFILILLFALSNNIYSQKFEIHGFQEGMSNMENLAKRIVRKSIEKKESANLHYLIVPLIYPANRFVEDMITYTDSLLESGATLTGEFPGKNYVDFYTYNDSLKFICSGSTIGIGTDFYSKSSDGYREAEFLFNAIIALNPEFIFKPDPIAGCYYVFTKDEIYKLKSQFDNPPIVTLLYRSKK